jgi:hypothetical protein
MAEKHFADALAVHRRMQAPFCIAATELAWGRLLLPREPDRAAALLIDAAGIAVRYRYHYLQQLALCRASQIPDPGPNKVRPGSEDDL